MTSYSTKPILAGVTSKVFRNPGLKNTRGTIAFLLLLVQPVCSAQTLESSKQTPKFADYHVEQLFEGKNADPKITTDWRLFRTRIRDGASQPPNFAGAYRIVEWGCGSDCLRFVLLDLRSGSIYHAPFESLWLDAFPTYGWYGKGLEYHADSRLLIADGCPTEKCATYYYEWTGASFHLIRSARNAPARQNHSAPKKAEFESTSMGEMKDEDGTHLGFTNFKASDGIGLTILYESFDSPGNALNYFEKQLDKAAKVIGRKIKLNPEGKVVGERAEILLRLNPQKVMPAVLWTDGEKFHEIYSSSLKNILELEKLYKY